MKKCLFCNKELGDERVEHIIPNCIGGKLKTKGLVCSQCNNAMSDLDGGFADLLPFTNLLSPKRDNGKTPTAKYKMDGMDVERDSEGHIGGIKIRKMYNNGDLAFDIQMRHTPDTKAQEDNLKKLKNFVMSASKNRKEGEKKYQETLGKIEKMKVDNNSILQFNLTLNAKGTLLMAAYKILIEYTAFKNLVDTKYLSKHIRILNERNNTELCLLANHYYKQDFFFRGRICNTIFVRGCKESKLLYGIVSIYGVTEIFFLLDDNYEGEDFKESYCYDLRNNKEIAFKKDLVLSAKNIAEILKIDSYDMNGLGKNTGNFLEILTTADKSKVGDIILQTVVRFNNEIQKYPVLLKEDEFWICLKNWIYGHMETERLLKPLLEADIDRLIETFKQNSEFNYEKYKRIYSERAQMISNFTTSLLSDIPPELFRNIKKLKKYLFEKVNGYVFDDSWPEGIKDFFKSEIESMFPDKQS
jgi:hypothetical protein